MIKIIRKNHHLNAEGKIFGRLATEVAGLLMGKTKTEYVPYLDCGDSVVIENIQKMRVTGNKLQNKIYYRHTGYPGGIKKRTLGERKEHNPEELFRDAVYQV